MHDGTFVVGNKGTVAATICWLKGSPGNIMPYLELRLIDIKGQEKTIQDLGSTIPRFAGSFTPDEKRFYYVAQALDNEEMLDTATPKLYCLDNNRKLLWQTDGLRYVLDFQISPDGKQIFIVGSGENDQAPCPYAIYDRDGKTLASGTMKREKKFTPPEVPPRV